MNSTHLHIRNMVCGRCLKVVGEILDQQGFNVISLELGKAYVKSEHEIDRESIATA